MIKRWWMQLLFDVPRFGQHAASRRRVLFNLIFALLFAGLTVAYIGPFFYFEYRYAGGWFGVGYLVVAYALAFSVRRFLKRKSAETVTLSLSSAAAPDLRMALIRQRRVFGLLAARAGLEEYRRTQPDAEGTGNGRVVVLDALRNEGLWDVLPARVRDAFAAAEGSWDETLARRSVLAAEVVQVLTWTVQETAVLPVMQHALVAMQHILADPIRQTEMSDAGLRVSFLRSDVALEGQHGPSLAYVVRIQNELVKRGQEEGEVNSAMETGAAHYMQYASMVGDTDVVAEDLPLGTHLVSEASVTELYNVRTIAAVRHLSIAAVQRSLKEKSVEALKTHLLYLMWPPSVPAEE